MKSSCAVGVGIGIGIGIDSNRLQPASPRSIPDTDSDPDADQVAARSLVLLAAAVE
jgi:hypothetical protein